MTQELESARQDLECAADRLKGLELRSTESRDDAAHRHEAAVRMARLEASIALGRVKALELTGHSHQSWD